MANEKEILEGKAAVMSKLRDIVEEIENESMTGVLLTYKDGELSLNLLNVNEIEATRMLISATSAAMRSGGVQ